MPTISGETIGNHTPATRGQKLAASAIAGAATAIPDAPAPEKTHTTPDSPEAIAVQNILKNTAEEELEDIIAAVQNDNYGSLVTDMSPVRKGANESRLKSNNIGNFLKKLNPFKSKSTNNGHEVLASVGVEAPDEQIAPEPTTTPEEPATPVMDLQAAGLDPIAAPNPEELTSEEPTPGPEERPYNRKGHDISESGIAREVEAEVAAFSLNRPDVGIPKAELDAAYEVVAKDEDGNVKDEFTLESILAEFGSKDKAKANQPKTPEDLADISEEVALRREVIRQHNILQERIEDLERHKTDLVKQIDDTIASLRAEQVRVARAIIDYRLSFDPKLALEPIDEDKKSA